MNTLLINTLKGILPALSASERLFLDPLLQRIIRAETDEELQQAILTATENDRILLFKHGLNLEEFLKKS